MRIDQKLICGTGFGLMLLTSSITANAQSGVGIDVANPQEMLDVNGAIKIGTDFTNTTAAPTGGAGTIRFRSGQFEGWDGSAWIPLGGGADSDWTVSGNNQYSAVSGNVGIGNSNPMNKLSFGTTLTTSPTNAGGKLLALYNNSAGTDFYGIGVNGGFGLSHLQFHAGSTPTEAPQMVLTGFGNVGIGTTSPGAKLEVAGQLKITGGSPAANRVLTSDANGLASWVDPTTLIANDGDWTISGNNQYSAVSGNIGIGTTAPTQKLHVVGNIRMVDGQQGVNKVMTSDGVGTAFWADPNTLIANDGDWTVSGNNIYNANTGNVGVGTFTPDRQLNIESATGPQMLFTRNDNNTTDGELMGELLFDNNDDTAPSSVDAAAVIRATASGAQGNSNKGGNILFLTKNNQAGTANASERMRIAANGNVGIGTATPASALHISNETSDLLRVYHPNLANGFQAKSRLGRSDAAGEHVEFSFKPLAGDATLSIHVAGDGYGTALTIEEGGNIGIGTANPATDLHVVGNIRMVDGNQAAGKVMVSDANGTATWTAATSLTITETDPQVSSTTTNYVPKWNGTTLVDGTIFDNGNVGIGNTAPADRLVIENYGVRNASIRFRTDDGTTAPTAYDASQIESGWESGQTAWNQSYIKFNTHPANTSAFGTSMTIKGANVGIGTATPLDKLHVAGSIRMVDGNQVAGYIPVSDANGTMTWTNPATITTAADGDGSSTNELQTLSISGNDISLSNGGGTVTVPNDGDWTVSGSDQYSAVTGNVGIGTNAPSQKLDILNGNLTVRTNANFTTSKIIISGARQGGPISWNAGLGTGQAVLDFVNYDGNNSSTFYSSSMIESINDPGSDDGSLRFMTASDMVLSEAMRIDYTGNVGIGASPLAKLHVVGNIRMVDGNQGAGKVMVSDANGTATWTAATSLTVTESDPQVSSTTNNYVPKWNGTTLVDGTIFDNGKVGIGTSNPATALHVATTTNGPTATFATGGVNQYPGAAIHILPSTHATSERASVQLDDWHILQDRVGNGVKDLSIYQQSTGIHRFTIDVNGNVGIGDETPDTKLDVHGSIQMVDGNQGAGKVMVSDANGTARWANASSLVADTDNDTKIQVEESADEDIIRFDAAGSQLYSMRKMAGGSPWLEVNSTNTFIGSTISQNVTNQWNTAVGYQSAQSLTSGQKNTLIGDNSGQSITTGSNNTLIGTVSGQSNNGSANTMIGGNAGRNNASGSGNVFLGFKSGENETGSNKLYIDNSNTTAPLIYGEFDNNLVGVNGNLGVGTQAPADELHVVGNIRMVDGNQAAGKVMVSDANGTASWANPAIATLLADADNDTKIQVEESADEDIIRFDLAGTEHFVMDGPRLRVLNSSSSVYIGDGAGASNSSGQSCVFIGNNAGTANTSGSQNNAIGRHALSTTATTTANNAFGFSALRSHTSGDFNVAIGDHALRIHTTGGSNTAIGASAFNNNLTGTNNTALGTAAGYNNLGSGNVFLGHNAGMAEAGSNKLYIDNSNASSPLIYGEFDNDILNFNANVGIGTSTPSAKLDIVNTGDGANVLQLSTERAWAFQQEGTGSGSNLRLRNVAGNNKQLLIDTDGSTRFRSVDGSTTSMIIDHSNGRVGIGTTNPTQAKFVIVGSVNNSLAYGWLNSSGNTGGAGSVVTNPYSLYASSRIAAVEFNAFSDERIKNIRGISNAQEDLITLMQIEVTDYTLRDTIAKGTTPHKKVIAQQVAEVYPQAVSKDLTDVVPDIYQRALLQDGWILLATDLKAGERVKIITETSEEVHEVSAVENGRFQVADLQNAEFNTQTVFVYGREVNDFHTVDYEALSTLNISATQELAKRLLRLEKENNSLKAENLSLKASIENNESRLQLIEEQLGIGLKAER